MAVLMYLEIPGGTTDHYDRTNDALGVHVETEPPEGLVHHVAGADDDGLVIVDIWESREALDDFVQSRLAAALQEAGVPPAAPRVYPVHNVIPQGSSDEANVLLVVEPKGFDVAMYDALVADMPAHAGSGESHPAAFHAVGTKEDGDLLVADVWPSEGAFNDFAQENLADAAAQLGSLSPRFLRVHNRIVG